MAETATEAAKTETEWKAEYRAYMVRCLTGASAWDKAEAEKFAASSADTSWDSDPTRCPEDSAQADLEALCDG